MARNEACSNCGHDNPAEARFCASCGAQLAALTEYGTHRLVAKGLRELVGETLAVYQKGFRPFVLIAFLAQIPTVLSLAISATAVLWVLAVVGLLLGILAQGAMIHAVIQHYLGRELDVAACYGRAWQKAGRLIIGALLFGGVLIIAALFSLFLIGIPVFFYMLVIWFFFSEAIMVEGKDPLQALGRSRELVAGSWWRVFAFVLIFLGIFIVIGVGQLVLAPISTTLADFFSTAAGIVVAPIASIGATLVYFDLRARKEGYSLERLASEVGLEGGVDSGLGP